MVRVELPVNSNPPFKFLAPGRKVHETGSLADVAQSDVERLNCGVAQWLAICRFQGIGDEPPSWHAGRVIPIGLQIRDNLGFEGVQLTANPFEGFETFGGGHGLRPDVASLAAFLGQA